MGYQLILKQNVLYTVKLSYTSTIMLLFIGCLRCAEYLFPLSSKFNEYVVMNPNEALSLLNYSTIIPSWNPNAQFAYFADQHLLLIGRSSVGNGTYRGPVYKGNGYWEIVDVAPRQIMLKNGPWCLGVRKEMLLVDERALVLGTCSGDDEQIFYVHDGRFLPRPSRAVTAAVLGSQF